MMRSAVARDFAAVPGVEVVATLDKRLPDDRGTWSTVRVGPGEEQHIVMKLAGACDYSIVIAPEMHGTLFRRAMWIAEAGGNSLGCNAETIELAGDKWQSHARLAPDTALRQPATVVLRSSADWPAKAPTRWVFKPIDGAGCLGTFVGHESTPLVAGLSYPALLQSYVGGSPVSASCLVRRDGRVLVLGIAQQHVRMEGGRLIYVGGMAPIVNETCGTVATRVLSHFKGARGWVGVDMVIDDDGCVTVIEINPRLTTAFVGFQQLVPIGTIARAWLALMNDCRDESAEADIARIAQKPPVTFRVRPPEA